MRRALPLVGLALALATAGAVSLTGGSLSQTHSMAVERAAHTMTTLRNGQVLVIGGFGASDGRPANPAVFDPEAMRFRPLANPLTWRHSHSATLLPDGNVLVVGGYGENNEYLRSAEVFDPRTGAVRPVGDLGRARAGHVTASLEDGQVLIVGGVGAGWTFLESAEIYDPATATFRDTGSMEIGRESHTATPLADGRVLIAGGHGGTRRDIRVFDSAEIYDPSTGLFTNARSPLTIRRHKHDAVRLADGRVLILGGADERDSRGVYRSTELFDPGAQSFQEHEPMRLPRYKLAGSTIPLDDGRFLITGGAERPEVYEPMEATFRVIATSESMPGLFSAATQLQDGRVLISGGYGNPGPATASAWIFEAN